jgi:hypothetical protein
MLKHLVRPPNSQSADPLARPLLELTLPALVGLDAVAANAFSVRRVEHRNGAGHLDPSYEAELRARVQDRARKTRERAFVSATSSANATAEEAGEEFVIAVTSGKNVDSRNEYRSDERGGPFVLTNADVEFAYDADETNPEDATREPFPTS